MTTTYELYTNENGTPKLVEGKAPAIIERVDTLETSVETLETSVETLETSVETLEETLDNGVVTSVNSQTGDVTVDVGVTSVNGKTGNVTLAVSDGTVSAKVSTSLTIIGRTAKTYTVTGLTANKPVFIGVKRTDTVSGYVYFWVSSGTGVETSTNNNTLYGQEDNIAIDNERAYWFPVVPTGTSIVFSHYIASDNTATLSLVVYQ